MMGGGPIRKQLAASSRRVRLTAGLALLAALIVLASQLAAEPEHGTVATAASRAPAPTGGAAAERRPRSTALAVDVPAGASPALYVKNHHHAAIRTVPGGGALVHQVGPRTAWGSRTTLAVSRVDGRWAQVITSDLPNDQLGWVKLDRRRLGLYALYTAIDVNLSTRRATLMRDGRAVRSFPVSIGAPGTDTPVGRFAVTDTFRGLHNPDYGCCALALTAHQPNLPSGWLGGNRIAIHGTYEAVGYAVSHGCVRAANSVVRRLVSHVPIGSLVDIHQ